MPKFAIIILNWRSAQEVYKNILRLVDSNGCLGHLVIVDNSSSDGSVEFLRKKLLDLFVSVISLDKNSIEGYDADPAALRSVYILENSKNEGYAGGNNFGMQFCLKKLDVEFVVLLNSDIEVESRAIRKLVEYLNRESDLAFASGILVYQDFPETVQCIGGGKYYPLFGRAKLYGKNRKLYSIPQIDVSNVNYLMGAVLAVRTKMLGDVGLMDEKYFLYCEELDWQKRALQLGWKIGICGSCIARHGDSGSTKGAGQSNSYYYYQNRSAILFNIKWHGYAFTLLSLPFLVGAGIIQCKTLGNVRALIEGVIDGLRYIGGEKGRRFSDC